MTVCDFATQWESSARLPGHKRLFAVNVTVSAGLGFSCIQRSKWIRFAQFVKLVCCSSRTMTNHVSNYVNPSVRFLFKQQQSLVIQRLRLRSEPVVLFGDMQYGSMGK